MPINLEIKIQMDSHESALTVLNNLSAEYVKVINQKDIYYSLPGSLLKLRVEDEVESLIKYNRDEVNDRFSNYNVIYMKSTGTEQFFNSIFTVEAVVIKKRILYMYNNTRIHLDTVQGLGTFMEFETLVLNGLDDARERFNFLIKKFNIDTTKQIKCSYRDLIINK
ncbi:MAG: class IV adenylate cyclase [Ignavibacteriaceae bacterium]|nr:class IV adenylate cyclase [Ignavibacteriaceae bacterium]